MVYQFSFSIPGCLKTLSALNSRDRKLLAGRILIKKNRKKCLNPVCSPGQRQGGGGQGRSGGGQGYVAPLP